MGFMRHSKEQWQKPGVIDNKKEALTFWIILGWLVCFIVGMDAGVFIYFVVLLTLCIMNLQSDKIEVK